MSLSDILNIAIAGIPVEIFVLGWIWTKIVRRLPENVQAKAREFATDAVQMVEQMHTGQLSSEQKKQIAVKSVQNMLVAAHLPAVPAVIIGDLIESAVWILNLNKPTPDNPPQTSTVRRASR